MERQENLAGYNNAIKTILGDRGVSHLPVLRIDFEETGSFS
jgi:hypothetical protein